MVCVMRRGHPAARGRLGLASLLRLQHLRVSISPVDSRFVDDALARLGHRRRVAANVPHWLVVPEILRVTDLVAVMPERLADVLARAPDGFARHDLPLPETSFEWSLYWHRRHEGSAQHKWLRGMVAEAVGAAPEDDARPEDRYNLACLSAVPAVRRSAPFHASAEG
jgi:DNA-binding transcriptional LysR family regulator